MRNKVLTNKIIGSAYTVYNRMGFGFLESVYKKCLLIEPQKESTRAEQQAEIFVKYDGHIVGGFKADLLIENEIIVELKSIKSLSTIHEVQLQAIPKPLILTLSALKMRFCIGFGIGSS